jgi:hypothetical protein
VRAKFRGSWSGEGVLGEVGLGVWGEGMGFVGRE